MVQILIFNGGAWWDLMVYRQPLDWQKSMSAPPSYLVDARHIGTFREVSERRVYIWRSLYIALQIGYASNINLNIVTFNS